MNGLKLFTSGDGEHFVTRLHAALQGGPQGKHPFTHLHNNRVMGGKEQLLQLLLHLCIELEEGQLQIGTAQVRAIGTKQVLDGHRRWSWHKAVLVRLEVRNLQVLCVLVLPFHFFFFFWFVFVILLAYCLSFLYLYFCGRLILGNMQKFILIFR